MIDLHVHTTFSFDGQSDPEDAILRAIGLGMKVFAFTEHFDYDSIVVNKPERQIDAEAYFTCARALQEKYAKRIRLLVGAEFGYDGSGMAQDMYKAILARFRPDYVINSLHFMRGESYKTFFTAYPDRNEAYRVYLECSKELFNASYRYDAIGHLGYMSRYAPRFTKFSDPVMHYSDFPDLYDEILLSIVRAGKVLEINGGVGDLKDEFCVPGEDVVRRYYELGGRKICYGGDSHVLPAIGRNYAEIAAMAKRVGFEGFTLKTLDGEELLPF